MGMGKIKATGLLAGAGYQAFDGLVNLNLVHLMSTKRSLMATRPCSTPR
ncbi:MAG: hypothetical protein R3E56_15175 [Burkholderiaceae bacterium]